MTRFIPTLAILSLFAVSCSTFNHTAVTLDQAVDRGRVKAISNQGGEAYFKNIVKEDSLYFGLVGKRRVQINELAITELYLTTSDIYKVWIETNSGARLKGYLYEVKPTSIIISAGPANPTEGEPMNLITEQVADIAHLFVREDGRVGRGYAKGTLAGMGVGAVSGLVLGAALGADSGGSLVIMAVGAGMIGPVGSIVGLITGSKRDYYEINGNQEVFDKIKYELKARAVIK